MRHYLPSPTLPQFLLVNVSHSFRTTLRCLPGRLRSTGSRYVEHLMTGVGSSLPLGGFPKVRLRLPIRCLNTILFTRDRRYTPYQTRPSRPQTSDVNPLTTTCNQNPTWSFLDHDLYHRASTWVLSTPHSLPDSVTRYSITHRFHPEDKEL